MFDAKEIKNCSVNSANTQTMFNIKIYVKNVYRENHQFISCSIDHQLCAELVLN